MEVAPKLQEMLRWNRWANRELAAVLVGAGGEPAHAVAAFQHIFETEVTWLRRIDGDDRPMMQLWGMASLDTVQALMTEAAERTGTLITALDNLAEPDRVITYLNSRQMEFRDPVGDTLFHMLVHSSQYRGETAGLLNASGYKVPDIDLIFWSRSGSPD